MGTLVSPGEQVTEYDLTQVIENIDSTIGAYAGVFRWGPVFERVLVADEPALVNRFFQPSNFNGEGWLCLSSFLAYGSPAQVVRVANTTANDGSQVVSAIANAAPVTNIQAQMVSNTAQYDIVKGNFDPAMRWVARWPGAAGSSLRVSVCDSPAAFQSTINLASANATLAINVSSNVATLTLVGASQSAANLAAIALANSFSVTDLVSVGNSSIGNQYLKISAINYNANATTGNTATITMNFQSVMTLSDNFQSNTTINRYWEFYTAVDSVPATSTYQASINAAVKDELHVVVTDDGGVFTGVTGTILETYKNLTRATDGVDSDGTANYYATLINGASQYVWFCNDEPNAPSATAATLVNSTYTTPHVRYFTGGADGVNEANISVSMLARGYDKFASAESVDVGLFIMGKARGGLYGEQTGNYVIDNIALVRKDLVVFRSPNIESVVNNTGNQASSIVTHRQACRYTSYGFMDTGYKQMYDKYNNVYRWVPLNGDTAGLCALTDYTNDAWWSPAGFNRGQIKNIVKLAYSPKQADRDLLYKNDVNPVVTFTGNGTVLFGDKTMFGKNSAFSRINVRRLFIVLENSVKEFAKYVLFEFNDPFTRSQFVATVTPYLRDVKGRRGISDYYVKSDAQNNPGQVVDNNRFVGTIAVKPSRAINFIDLQFVAVGTDLAFSYVDQALGTALTIS